MQLTLKDLKKNNFAHFASIGDKFTRLNQINALVYLENLAALSGTKIDNWPVLEIFKDEAGQLVTAKNQINARFFKHRETQAAPPSLSTVPQDQLSMLKDLGESLKRSRMTNLQREVVNYQSSINRYYREIDTLTAGLLAVGDQLKAFDSMSFDPSVEVAKIIASGKWRFLNVDHLQWVSFATVNDIILTYRNDAQGINCSVNLGLFKVQFNLGTGAFRVYKLGRNLEVNGYYHPHVSGGNLCTGEVNRLFSEAISKRDLARVLDIAFDVLSSYNHDSPYVLLTSFDALAKHQQDPNGYNWTSRVISTDSVYYKGEMSPKPEEEHEDEDSDEYEPGILWDEDSNEDR